MSFVSLNPVTGEILQTFAQWTDQELDANLHQVATITDIWRATSLAERSALFIKLAHLIRQESNVLAQTICLEMGKLLTESKAEIEKCALACDFYAAQARNFLSDEIIQSDASRSLVAYQPLGTVLAVMPWNFPFWQVFRFAIPSLLAGNTGVLKHASNVPQCAMAIEDLFLRAGFPTGVFKNLMISAERVQAVIEDKRIHAVTLTGSETAGRKVAAIAGACLKKSVLELGGSDPFVILADADITLAINNAVISRFLNAGQSCIAAKRFIVVESVAQQFIEGFKQAVEQLVMGDPMERMDLRDQLHQQVLDSIAAGAHALTGCRLDSRPGAYYPPSILDHVKPGQPAYTEELFGPVAIIIRVKDEPEALRIANDTKFGLGGSVWTQDEARGEQFARRVQAGAVFVNGFVKSDPRLPFGGIKASGYGRELAIQGIREFVNIKTIWIK